MRAVVQNLHYVPSTHSSFFGKAREWGGHGWCAGVRIWVVLGVMGVVGCVGCSGVCRGPIVQRLVVFCFYFISFCFFLSPVFFLQRKLLEQMETLASIVLQAPSSQSSLQAQHCEFSLCVFTPLYPRSHSFMYFLPAKDFVQHSWPHFFFGKPDSSFFLFPLFC